MNRVTTLALSLACLAGAPAAHAGQAAPAQAGEQAPARAQGQPQDAQHAPAFESAGALLEALERSTDDLRALWCQVVYDRRFILQGDTQIRIGTIAFAQRPETEETPRERRFAVRFDLLILGDEQREDRQEFAFDGRWIVERRFDDKVFVKRELAPEGQSFDPLELGKGPLPLPVGQRRDAIEARYTAALAEASEGFDEEDPTDDGYAAFVRNAVQLVLIPRADAPDADERFREIRLWYGHSDASAALLPMLARTVDRSGDVVFVQLVGVRTGEALPDEVTINLSPPPANTGWDVQIEEGRFGDGIEGVQIGAAPSPLRRASAPDARILFASQPSAGDITRELADDQAQVEGADPSRLPGGMPPVDAPDIDPLVMRTLGAGYLSDEERADKRVFHGLWQEGDLDDPARAARAALASGVWDHPAFDDPRADPLDAAEAMVLRGDIGRAFDILADQPESARMLRLIAEAFDAVGDRDEALQVLEEMEANVLRGRYTSASDITQAASAIALLTRLDQRPAASYQAALAALTGAHQRVDRLYWPALVQEALLLDSKGNAGEALDAANRALTLTTASSGAWNIVGMRMVAAFATDNALSVAERLHRLERRLGDRTAFSPTGDLIAARAYLRLNDPELASFHVERVLKRYPKHREALALRCAVAATAYDFDRLEELLSQFDALAPGHPLALYEAGAALSERRQYAEASEYLGRAIDRAPAWSTPIVELGLMEVQAARDTVARDVLERAVELDPFHTRARNSLALVNGLLTEFATLESDHFIVRYKPGPDEVMAREMLDDLEEMHDVVASAMEHVPARKTLFEVMPDHSWFSVRITGMPQIHTIAAATGPIIAMEAPKVGKRHTGIYDWLRVARHEYTHTVTLDRTKNRIPLWFTEAAAVRMELAPRDYNTVQLLTNALLTGTLFDLEEIDLGFIRPEKPTDRPQAYAQAHWMWEFIEETWGNEKNIEMMDRFAAGQRVPRVLADMFDETPDSFMQRFTDWARADASEWGLLPEPSLGALRLEETLADEELLAESESALGAFARAIGEATVTGAERVDQPDLPLVRVSPDVVEFWSEIYPDHPDVLNLMVQQALQEAAGNAMPEHIELLERYAAARPTDPMPHRHLARLHLRSEDPSRAIPHLEYLDAREVYSPAYAVALAKRYSAQGRYADAMEAAQRATRIAPFDGDYRELAAEVAVRMGDLPLARTHIEALTILEPDIALHKRRLDAVDQRLRDAG